MQTAAERLSRTRLNIERAKKHIREFEQRLEAFRQMNPYGFVREDNPETTEHIYRVRVSAEPPVEDLALIAGDAIHQTRSALDHLAWQLVEANGKNPRRETAFPICKGLAEYEAPGSRAKIKRVSASAKSLIKSLQPFNTGSNELLILNDLDNFDKHRLIFVVAADFGCTVIKYTGGTPTNPGIRVQVGAPKIQHPGTGFTVLHDGAVILRMFGETEPEAKEEFEVAFEIAFLDPKIVKRQPVLPLLHQLAAFVDSLIGLFASHL